MTGSMWDDLENEVLDHLLGGGDFARPATVYIALFTAAPSDSTFGTEVTGGAYARAAVTNNVTNWPAAAAGAKKNGAAITFATATASWGTVTHFGILSHLTSTTANNRMFWGALSTSKAISANDVAKFAVSAISITLT